MNIFGSNGNLRQNKINIAMAIVPDASLFIEKAKKRECEFLK